MFTNQWNGWLTARLLNYGTVNVPSGLMKATDGTTVKGIFFTASSSSTPRNMELDTNSSSVYSVGSSYSGIKFGTGTTAPTITDYTLDSIVTSSQVYGVSASATNSGRYDSTGNFSVTYTNTIKNNSNSVLTITEVGLFLQTYLANKAVSSDSDMLMVWRDVFTNPIVLADNETKTIETVITFPVPTA